MPTISHSAVSGTNANSGTSSTTTLASYAHTGGLLAVFVGENHGDDSLSSVTFNSVSLTRQGTVSSGAGGNDKRVFLYTGDFAATTADIVASYSVSRGFRGLMAFSLGNAELRDAAGDVGTGNSAITLSATMDTESGDLVIWFARWRQSAATISGYSGLSNEEVDDSPTRMDAASGAGGATSTTVSGTLGAVTDQNAAAIAVSLMSLGGDIEKAGRGISDLIAGGADAVEFSETGTGTITAIGGGADSHEASESGGTVSALSGGGMRAVEFTKAGGASSSLVGSGADALEASETGGGVAALTGVGVKQVEYTESGAGVTTLDGSGAGMREATKAGGAIAVLIGGGAKAVEYTEAGAGVSALVGSGESVHESADIIKAGGASSTLSGAGIKLVEYTETGGAIIEAIGSGAAFQEYTKSGGASSALVGSGSRIAEFTKAGGAVSTLVGAGVSSAEYTEGGGAVITMIGGGVGVMLEPPIVGEYDILVGDSAAGANTGADGFNVDFGGAGTLVDVGQGNIELSINADQLVEM